MLDRFKGLQLNFLHGLLVVVFLVGIACVEWVINLTSSQYQQLKSNRATTELVGIRSQMEQLFGEASRAAFAFSSYFSVQPVTEPVNTRLLAVSILKESPVVKRVSVWRNQDLMFAYPITPAMTLWTSQAPKQYDLTSPVAQLFENYQVSSPRLLENGALALDVTLPIYTRHFTFSGFYWGSVRLLVDISEIMRRVREGSAADYELALSRASVEKLGEEVFLGNPDILNTADATTELDVFNETWQIHARAKHTNTKVSGMGWLRFFGYAGVIVLAAVIALLSRSYRALHQQAQTDVLTGLLNRRALTQRFKSLASRNDKPLEVIYIDLNKFKPINDRYGHAVGDKFLMHVASILNTYVNAKEAGRIGGDEFVVLRPLKTSELGNSDSVKDIVEHLREHPFVFEKGELTIHASVGRAEFPAEGRSLEELLHVADERMYEDKNKNT